MSPLLFIVFGALVLLLVIVALSAIRVVQQYERGIIFVLGRLTGAKGPGLFLVPPFISRMSKIDLRIVTLTVPPQEVITRDEAEEGRECCRTDDGVFSLNVGHRRVTTDGSMSHLTAFAERNAIWISVHWNTW